MILESNTKQLTCNESIKKESLSNNLPQGISEGFRLVGLINLS